MSEKFVKLPVNLIGKVSERALILYALMIDRLELSRQHTDFQDADGRPFIYYTRADVERVFGIKHCTATALFAELETAGLIVRRPQGQGKPIRIFFQTSEKSAVKTSEKSDANHTNHNHTNYNHHQQNNSEICENQQTFDDLFLMMTVKDVVAEILCQLVAKNPQEFAEINAEIINFVAENIRNAAENKKIANLTGYARAALRRGKADFEASGSSKTKTDSGSGYGATYDIAAYESVSAADNPEWGGENYDTGEISTNAGEKQI